MSLARLFVACLFFALAAAAPAYGQSFQSGTVTVRTGADDLRAGSAVFIGFMRGNEVLDEDRLTAEGESLPSNTSENFRFRIRPLALADVEFIQVRFSAGQRNLGVSVGDDQWGPSSMVVRVDDGTPGGRVLFDSRVPKMNEDRPRFLSPPLATFGRALTRVTFTLNTGDDDLRVDSGAFAEVETVDGRAFKTLVHGKLDNRSRKVLITDLPPGVTSDQIRFARLHYTGYQFPFMWTTPISALYQGDQWELSNFGATATDADGRTVDLVNSRRIKFERPGWFESPPLRPQRLPFGRTSVSGRAPTRFVIFIYTGGDDLRTDPAVQPNSELDVRVNLRDGRSVLLDTGRAARRSFVGPSDTAFFGTFKDWGVAWAVATAPESIAFANIANFSITMTRGRGQRGVITGGTPDPFRGADEWALHGFWVGVSPSGGLTGDPSNMDQMYSQALRIFSQFNIGAKLNSGNPTFTSASFR